MGKDITKFHAIFWPAFLMAAGLPPPRRIVAHAHWTVGRVKMSKSLGNVVRPGDLVEQFGVDAVRYFLLREGALEADGDFSEEGVLLRLRGDLADTLGISFHAAAPRSFSLGASFLPVRSRTSRCSWKDQRSSSTAWDALRETWPACTATLTTLEASSASWLSCAT